MNYTSNMGMNMPDENDKFSIEHFNTNTQALDIVGKPDEYKNTKTYAVGDLCIHNNILYKCIIAVETAEEFNAEKWEVTSLCKEEIANKTAIAELNENMQNRFKIMKFQLPPDTTANTKVYTATESDLMDYFPVGISAYVQSDTDAFWINNAEHIQQVLLRADGIYITLKSTYLVNQWARLLLCRYPT